MGKGDGSGTCAPDLTPTKRRGQAQEELIKQQATSEEERIQRINEKHMKGMSEAERAVYALRQKADPFLARNMELEQGFELRFRYPDSEGNSTLPDGDFIIEEEGEFEDERGLMGEDTRSASWKIPLPGGLEAEIALIETPRGPMKEGTILWTSDNIYAVKTAIEDVLERLVEEADKYDEDPTQSRLAHADNTLARMLSHYHGCSEEEAFEEIRRVREAFYKSATDIDLQERRKRCQEICENLAGGYKTQKSIDALGGEEVLDAILSERADMSDKSFAEYIAKNHLSDDYSASAVYINEEIQNYRNGEYGDEKRNLSDSEIIEELVGDLGEEEEEWRDDWKQEKTQEVFSALENDEKLLEVFERHNIYEAYAGEGSDLGRLARESGHDFVDFFNENSKYSTEISYGINELARDMGVEIEGGSNDESDFIFSEGRLKELEPLDDECMQEPESSFFWK